MDSSDLNQHAIERRVVHRGAGADRYQSPNPRQVTNTSELPEELLWRSRHHAHSTTHSTSDSINKIS
jgi:hypothetical protein